MAPVPHALEFALLAAATARPIGVAQAEAVESAIAHPIDWAVFERLVARHRIAPLAFECLSAMRDRVPDHAYVQLRAAAMNDRANALQLAGVLARVIARLSDVGIDALSMKGPTLAMLAFGDASLRQCRDLDILIPPERLEAALAALAPDCRLIHPAGFDTSEQLRLWARIMKDVMLLHEPTGAVIELHWRLADNPHLVPATVATPRRSVKVGPADIPVLGADDLLLYLCVHGATHCWFRLKWLADVRALIADEPDAIARFHDYARAHGLEIPAQAMLLLLAEVYGVAIPQAIRDRAKRSWRVRRAVGLSLRFLHEDSEPDDVRFTTTMMALGRLLLHRSPRYLVREVVALLVDGPTARGMGGSRWAYTVAIFGRPVFWIVRKLRLRPSIAV